jgi:hypothetical protein
VLFPRPRILQTAFNNVLASIWSAPAPAWHDPAFAAAFVPLCVDCGLSWRRHHFDHPSPGCGALALRARRRSYGRRSPLLWALRTDQPGSSSNFITLTFDLAGTQRAPSLRSASLARSDRRFHPRRAEPTHPHRAAKRGSARKEPNEHRAGRNDAGDVDRPHVSQVTNYLLLAATDSNHRSMNDTALFGDACVMFRPGSKRRTPHQKLRESEGRPCVDTSSRSKLELQST